MQSENELTLIRASLCDLERKLQDKGRDPVFTRAMLQVLPIERREDAIADTLEWLEDALREAQARARQLAILTGAGLTARPPRSGPRR